MSKLSVVMLVGAAVACSGPDDEKGPGKGHAGNGSGGGGASGGRAQAMAGDAGQSGAGRSGGGGRGGAKSGAGGTKTSAGGATAAAGEAGAGAGEGGAGGTLDELVPLPEGSRVRAGVVNLVDAAAAAELQTYLEGTGVLEKGLNLFLRYYEEEYDFVYLFTDHKLTTTTTAGRYVPVTHPAIAGTGVDYDDEEEGYATTGRTRGVIGIQYNETGPGPLDHELLHHWANFLGSDLGFGTGKSQSFGPHWGYTGFRGVLGGFDASTLRCETPAGAMPPCTAESDGSYRYRVGSFGTGGNDGPTFAPLELYLMGLLSLADVPSPIMILEDATTLDDTYDVDTNTIAISASGIRELDTQAIVDKLGSVAELAQSDRAYRAAFVVISATPASDAVLDDIGGHVEEFDGRKTEPKYPSFAAMTGGRASMDAQLRARRRDGSHLPDPRVIKHCDLLAQDCGAGKGCNYFKSGNVCGISRGGTHDEPCRVNADCAPGFYCSGNSTQERHACEAYCSLDDASPQVCPYDCDVWGLQDSDEMLIAAACMAP